MAIVEVKVPQLSESVAEATLLQWKKKPGEAVAIDEILIEIETDKVVLEVPAPAAGVLTEVVEDDGATVAAEQLIARIAPRPRPAPRPPRDAVARAAGGCAGAQAPAPTPSTEDAQDAEGKGRHRDAAAAKLMAERGIDPASVTGTGRAAG